MLFNFLVQLFILNLINTLMVMKLIILMLMVLNTEVFSGLSYSLNLQKIRLKLLLEMR